MTDQPPKPRRRWFQFSLRTLLILVTLVAGLLVAWRAYVEPYRRQRETMKLIEELGGNYKAEPGGSDWLRWLFGDSSFQNIVEISFWTGPSTPMSEGEPSTPMSRDNQLLFYFQRQVLTLPQRMADATPTLTIDNIPLIMFPGDKSALIMVSDVCLARLGRLTNLRTLDLSVTDVSDAGLDHLKGLTNLQELRLFGTQVSDAGLAHLKGLSKLQTLDLGYTQVSDEGLAHLKGLTNLQTLRLDLTQVTDADLVHLKGLTNLRNLALQRTQVTDSGVKKLQKALPNCDILH